MKKKRNLVIALSICLSIVSQSVSAIYSTGFSGVSTYSSSSGNCVHGDRAGAQYVQNLYAALAGITYQCNFLNKNSSANEKDMTLDTRANSCDFFAYSGHGHGGANESTAHYFARSTGESWHDSSMEDADSVNARTNEVRFGHGTLKWVTMYSCHWLENGGSTTKLTNIFNTFEGATLTMGFASVMYLDSREGTLYGNNLVNGKSIRRAFLDAAQKYQPQRSDGDAIARVQGYTNAQNDTCTSYVGCLSSANWYKNNPSQYSTIETNTIPHTGIKIN